jgi:tetratricopeptide (TPR) repeat protein
MSSAPRTSSRSFTRSIADPGRCARHDTRRLAGVALLFLCLSGCAVAPQTRALRTTPPAALPERIELTSAPLFPQQRYQCGPAALASVLAANGIAATPEQLVDEVYLPGRQGSLFVELAAAARHRGLLAYPLAPSMADLLTEIAAGHPVLVFQNLGLDWLPLWHFAVAFGYDLRSEDILLRSGTEARRSTPFSVFERTWQRSGYRALVILPPDTPPATAQPLPFLRAARDLDATGNHAAARAAWQAAIRRWPDNPLAWMALGNRAFRDGEQELASSAFAQVTRLAPRDPDGWNNLAYTLLQQGCPQQALAAVQCALQLAPGDANLRDTDSTIRKAGPARSPAVCMPIHCPLP